MSELPRPVYPIHMSLISIVPSWMYSTSNCDAQFCQKIMFRARRARRISTPFESVLTLPVYIAESSMMRPSSHHLKLWSGVWKTRMPAPWKTSTFCSSTLSAVVCWDFWVGCASWANAGAAVSAPISRPRVND